MKFNYKKTWICDCPSPLDSLRTYEEPNCVLCLSNKPNSRTILKLRKVKRELESKRKNVITKYGFYTKEGLQVTKIGLEKLRKLQ